jgi:hypothetical protein
LATFVEVFQSDSLGFRPGSVLFTLPRPRNEVKENVMDESALRDRLTEAQGELKRLDTERDAFVEYMRALERLLKLKGPGQLRLGITIPPPPGRAKLLKVMPAKGGPSMRSTVLKILRDAHGEPLHAREILSRAQAQGATTGSKDPEAVVDLMGYSLKRSHPEVVKVAARTWRWAGE